MTQTITLDWTPDCPTDGEGIHAAVGDDGTELTIWAEPDGTFRWSVDNYTQIISGPPPGTPDEIERNLGSGTAPTDTIAEWAAFRCWQRSRVADEVAIWEDITFLAGDTHDPKWWVA